MSQDHRDQKNNGQNETNFDQKAGDPLLILRNSRPCPSPYLKTRVLAQFRAQEERHGQGAFHRWFWQLLSAGLALALVFSFLQRSPENTYNIAQPYMVRVDLRNISNLDLGYAVVELQDSHLRFVSQKFSLPEEIRQLTVDWQNLIGQNYLPIIVEGTQTGRGRVAVKFYSKEKQLIEERDILLHFSREKEGS